MHVSFFLAYRYFRQAGQRRLIHRIGFIAFLSVALSTMTLLLVLAVFNGLEGFIKELFSSFDPDIRISVKQGKSFERDEGLLQCIDAVEGVANVVEVVEDNALLRYQERYALIRLKGVSDAFLKENRLAPFITEGQLRLKQGGQPLALLGNGVQYMLSVPIANALHRLQIFYPHKSRGGAALPQQLFSSKSIRPEGVFAVEKRFDEGHVLVPLDFAAELMGMGGRWTALEIQVAPGKSIKKVQHSIKKVISDHFQVLNRDEQQASLVQAIYIERLFVFATFSFILFVASLNIFFILSMMVLDKRKDIAVLYTLGAYSQTIQAIFLWEGLLIALSGATIGMLGACVLGWVQQTFGLVSLGAQTSLVDAYPIEMRGLDFVYTGLGVVLITLLAAIGPAQLAARRVCVQDGEAPE